MDIKPKEDDEWSYAERNKASIRDKKEIDYEKQRDKLRKEQDKFTEKRDKQKENSFKRGYYQGKIDKISKKLEKIRY